MGRGRDASWLLGFFLAATGTPSVAASIPDRAPATVEELLQWYPSRNANTAALDTEKLAAAVGVDLTPRSRMKPEARISNDARREREKVDWLLSDYLSREIEKEGGAIERPPQAVRDFLAAQAASLATLRHRLTHGETPLWERHLEEFDERTLPNLLGHMRLQKLLLASCLDRLADGDRATAFETLEASWSLCSALTGEPSIIEQFIAIASARLQFGVMRRVDDLPVPWSNRLLETDLRTRMLRALRAEGCIQAMAPPPTPPASWPVWRMWLDRAIRPVISASLRVAGRAWLEAVDRVAASRPSCETDFTTLKEQFDRAPLTSRVLGLSFFVGISECFARVARAEVDLELTEKILDLRAARRQSGAWPATLRGLSDSRACPHGRWVYEVTPGGEASLRLDPVLVWPKVPFGSGLPTRWSSSAPAGDASRAR